MWEWSSIHQSLPSPKSSLERSFRRAYADWYDWILKLSSARLRCWFIHVFVCCLHDWACSKSCADWKGCPAFHCSEYLWCLLYNPVTLPYAVPPTFSTSTICLWALIFVESGVQARSGFWGSIISSSGAFSGGRAPGTVCMGRWISWLSWSMAIEMHRLKSNRDGSGRFQPAGDKISSGNCPSLICIGWYCY